MSTTAAARVAEQPRYERVLGRVEGTRPGPTLLAIGGIHGNEPSGVSGLERVLAALAGREADLAGRLVALSGNIEALTRGVRFVDRDLNRCWSEERAAALEATAELLLGAEDREQLALEAVIEEVLAEAAGASGGAVYILDLHSTSGGGPPFGVLNDTLPNRRFAAPLPVPLVLGLEEELEGTLLNYFGDRGYVNLGFESGQHDADLSVDHAEAAVWQCLESAGMLAPPLAVPPAVSARLDRAARGLPPVVEVRYRHPVEEGDAFRMEPGYVNFQPVAEGQLLARDREREIRAPESGLILMPLYQPQGEDGFFIVRPVRAAWLRLSAVLRKAGADRIVHWLPGVARHPSEPGTYRVNRRLARWYALEIFHLLGFRRHGTDGDSLTVSRRPDRVGR